MELRPRGGGDSGGGKGTSGESEGSYPLMRLVRSWVFALGALPTLLQSVGPPDSYTRASERQLDSLYAPLVYLMRRDEQGVYPSLTLEGKRAFLRDFWARRNPTPGGTKNAAADEFDTRLAYVNHNFREEVAGAREVAGWRTDRGRIYLEEGPPDIVLFRRWPKAPLPFQVWKYMKGKPRKYVFVDVTLYGNFVLVYSSDEREPTRPDWTLLVGADASREIERF